MVVNCGGLKIEIKDRELAGLSYNGKTLICAPSELFRIRLRYNDGTEYRLGANDAGTVAFGEDSVTFGGFPVGISAELKFTAEDGRINVFAEIKNGTEAAVEWAELLPLKIKPLEKDGGETGTGLLLPYNEGLLLDSVKNIPDAEPEYPSLGGYFMFPNMMCSQFAAYLFENNGVPCFLSVSAYDEKRAPKEITVRRGELVFRQFTGGLFGGDIKLEYPLSFTAGEGGWQSAAEIYRSWFEKHLPPRVRKTKDNKALPDWYRDNLLVLTYPVRGVHDMDKPEPNAFFPYENALPVIDEIHEKTGCKPMALLMHWEGTAPWAPPYVMPPYGGLECFDRFRDALHDRGFLLGVYCSGFGFTERSNIIPEYDMTEKIEKEGLLSAMCAAPDGRVYRSRICTGQRSGYDICPYSEKGKEILMDAYGPLFSSGTDYAQILDQNHGGGQYFCYSRKHGHAPTPGGWMTDNMQKTLGEWNESAGKMLLGCESAAAEPFIGNLLLSDNRFELCYAVGRPVPLYSFIYHEYLRNFMGNQVSNSLPHTTDGLLYRIAYSFSAGDIPTLVLTPDGGISPSWSTRDFSIMPDRYETIGFVGKLSKAFDNGLSDFLTLGRMTEISVKCGNAEFGNGLPEIIVSAFEYNGKKAVIMINPFKEPKTCTVLGEEKLINGRSVEYKIFR